MPPPSDITALLGDWSRGNQSALNQLLPLVYTELRRMAQRHLRGERAGHTLQATALVHEVYLRLIDQRKVDWRNRAHFFGVSARVMRRILVDHARSHNAVKRGDGQPRVSIDEAMEVAAPDGVPILALDQALERLTKIDEGLAKMVELRAFGGMTIDEAACVLNVSASTAKRTLVAAIPMTSPETPGTNPRFQRGVGGAATVATGVGATGWFAIRSSS